MFRAKTNPFHGSLIGLIVLLVLTPGLSNSATWYVKPDGTGDVPTIAAAFAVAVPGDIVLLADGAFPELGLDMPGGVILRSESGNADAVVIGFCPGGPPGARVMNCSGDNTTRIEGVSFLDACFFAGSALGCGGEVQIVDCAFRGNFAQNQAGAVFIEGGSPRFERCVFESNSAAQGIGGAVYSEGAPVFVDCVFETNSASSGGGAVFGLDVEFYNCLFVSNFGGGAVLDLFGAVIIDGCTFYDNSVLGGGGAVVDVGAATITNTIIAASPEGQAIACSNVTLSCSNIYGNVDGDYVSCISGELGMNGNISEDPLFCDAANGDLTLDAASPCLPPNNTCGVLMGAEGLGCGDLTCPPGPRIGATGITGWIGQQADMYLYLQQSPVDVDAFTMDLSYDTAVLRYVSCVQVDLTQNWLQVNCSENVPGVVRVLGFNPAPPIPTGSSGNLVRLTFEVIGCPTHPSLLIPANLQDDFAGMDVCAGVFAGCCVSDGDVNADGSLTAGDALCCFNIALAGGQIPPDCDVPNWDCEVVACDVNCDNSLTAGDALEIFNRGLLGMDPLSCFAQFSGPAASAGAEVKAFDVPLKDAVSSGSDLTVPVRMEATPGAAAFGFEVRFDAEKVKFEGILIREAAEHWKGLGAKQLEPGRVRVMGFDNEGLKGRSLSLGGMVEIAALRFHKLSDDAFVGPVEWIEQRLDREPDSMRDRVAKLDLSRPYPNPFRDAVSADVHVPGGVTSTVSVSVYNIKGQLVTTLLNQPVSGGTHRVSWDRRTKTGEPVSSGIYFLRMEVQASGFTQTWKLVVLR